MWHPIHILIDAFDMRGVAKTTKHQDPVAANYAKLQADAKRIRKNNLRLQNRKP